MTDAPTGVFSPEVSPDRNETRHAAVQRRWVSHVGVAPVASLSRLAIADSHASQPARRLHQLPGYHAGLAAARNGRQFARDRVFAVALASAALLVSRPREQHD